MLTGYVIVAQVISPKPVYKHRTSAYDTNALYFNKWKVNVNCDIGVGLDNGYILNSPGQTCIFGVENIQYTNYQSPVYNISGNYGFSEKSAVGIDLSYQYYKFIPISASPVFQQGRVDEYNLAAEYLHCIRSWKHFYYGIQIGVSILGMQVDTNTYLNKPVKPASNVQPFLGELIGFRFPVQDGLWIRFEVSSSGLLSNPGNIARETIGINYVIDTRTNCHKPVKTDPNLLNHNTYVVKHDSLRTKRGNIRSIYDTNSLYYNKKRIHFTLQIGNSDLDAVVGVFFGGMNSAYSESMGHLVNFSADYGIREKSCFGIDVLYQHMGINVVTPGPYYTPGNIDLFMFNERYTHCLWSWKYFYYGIQAGVYVLNLNYNPFNTFTARFPVVLPPTGFNMSLLAGTRITLIKKLCLSGEMAIGSPFAYFDLGLTYTIDARKLGLSRMF